MTFNSNNENKSCDSSVTRGNCIENFRICMDHSALKGFVYDSYATFDILSHFSIMYNM